ncbi:hypothetical protein ACFQZS_00850 [Mucilaginibacter calamicampi]|uniref:Outer membrane protein beta-barrel domain-containing protein n=1 Tax=Mucilaginibacter calamicampi TaxID=1302352 RepID=A0ABW2YTB8_9SPHI
MKKTIYFLAIFISFLVTSKRGSAQDYKWAAGLKFGGYESGVSGKYFMQSNVALEGIVGFRNSGVVVTGLYEIHQPAFNLDKLKFYYGFGAHFGSVGRGQSTFFAGTNHKYYDASLLVGADGVLGLEYVIPKSPIAVSLDLNPRVELARGPFFDIAPGLGVKYTF